MSDNPKLLALVTSLRLVLDRIKILIDEKADLDHTAISAEKLENARTIAVIGDASGSVVFDGTSNVNIPLTLPASGAAAGQYGSNVRTLQITVDSKGRVIDIGSVDIRQGSLASSGLVQLSSNSNSTSESVAATPKAVKGVRDIAVAAIPAAEKGAANGVATLDANGQVPSNQLPSFVDDVLEFDNLQAFPATGERGKLYIALDNNYVYRWTGSAYIWISSSVGVADSANRLSTARTINGQPFDGTENITLPTVNTTGNQTVNGTKTFNNPIVGSITGKAAIADRLETARNVVIGGDVAGSNTFDGSGDLNIITTLANSGVTPGSYGTTTKIPVLTVDSKGRVVGVEELDVPGATTSIAGLVRLSSAVNSTSATIAATSAAVKIAYDLANAMIRSTDKGAPNGVATLDGNGQVPSSQLPSYVDDVLEFTTLAEFPATGETGKIYVETSSGNTYRWSGSVYIRIGANASSADVALKLATARSLTITGDASWTVNFDGSANASAAMTLTNSGVTAGTYGDADNIPRVTVDSKGRVTNVALIARPTNASTAEKLDVPRNIALSGDATGTTSFDGSQNVGINVTLSNTGVAAGSYTKVSVDAKGRVTGGGGLVATDIPTLTISKTSGLQAALDEKFNASALSSAVNSTSTTTAATSAAVKQAYDLAGSAIPISARGAANGVAALDANGQVPASQLPSYVDDVLEFASLAVFPTTGETGKIYVAINNGNIYRWSGTTYIQIGGSTGAAESALKLTTARTIGGTGDVVWSVSFDGSANVSSSMTLSNTGVTPGVYSKMTVDAKGRITGAAALLASDIPTLNQDTTGNAATATKLATSRTLTLGSTAKGFDGTANVSWTLAEIGAAAAAHTHDYLPLSGGTVTGITTFSNTQNATSGTTGAVRIAGGLGVGGDVWAAGDVTAFSDERLKKDICVIEDALERIFQLRGVTYTRTDGELTGRRQTGLIAQDVQKAMPEAVKGGVATEEDPNGYLGVAYGNLVGLLVEGIKELSGKVDDLQSQIDNITK